MELRVINILSECLSALKPLSSHFPNAVRFHITEILSILGLNVIEPFDTNIMKKKKQSKLLKPIPGFRNEDEEREFWATHDSTEYIDWSKAEEPLFPNLKRTTELADSGEPAQYVGPRITGVSFCGDIMTVNVDDGQVISVRWNKYKRLRNSSDSARNNFMLIGSGTGIHWPELDEDLSLAGLIRDSQNQD